MMKCIEGKKRVFWTDFMEEIFIEAIEVLGDNATPKPILEVKAYFAAEAYGVHSILSLAGFLI